MIDLVPQNIKQLADDLCGLCLLSCLCANSKTLVNDPESMWIVRALVILS
jgi:hypothetical protein